MREQLELFVQNARAGNLNLGEIESALRREYIVQVLEANRLNQCAAARDLGWHRNTLSRNLHDLAIDVNALRAAKKPVASAVTSQAAKGENLG